VRPEHAALGRIYPFQGSAPLEPANGGTYSMRAHMLGGTLQYIWGEDDDYE
jgi:hypothetical protein